MKLARDILVIIASLFIVVYVSDVLVNKYKPVRPQSPEITCLNTGVENLLLSVVTKDVAKKLEAKGVLLTSRVLSESTITDERKPTINNKAKYSCSTELFITLTSKNQEGEDYIKALTRGSSSNTYNNILKRSYTVAENDQGTNYWVSSERISEYDFKILGY